MSDWYLPRWPTDPVPPWFPSQPSAAEQWQNAIEQQRQREAAAPSMGQQIGDIINRTILTLGSPIFNQAQRMQNAYEQGINWNDPEQIKQLAGGSLMDVAGLAAGPAGLAERGTVGALGGKPITVYHGSPHDFEKFDLSRIGTGEGAQAYGHGLYFAENEGVASTYKMEGSTKFIGEEEGQALRALNKANGDREAAAKELRSMAADRRQAGVSGSPTLAQAMAQSYDRSAEMLERGWQPPKGKMYQVAIKADPEHFLDWDKPLSEQPREVQEKLRRAGVTVNPNSPTAQNYTMDALLHDLKDYPVQAMMDDLAAQATGSYETGAKNASDKLRQAGIPGIKYLDQGSRTSGEGSRNYVVFDDKLIDIIKKYGWAGLLGPAAAQYLPAPGTQQ